MATNDQTRRVEFPNVPPRINPPGAPKPAGKAMPKKSDDDAKWMAGLAAVLGLGLGGGVAYAAGTFDGEDGPTDAELAAAQAKVDAAADANEAAAQQEEVAPVQERVVEVHHVHHHDHHDHAHHAAPTAESSDIEVMGYSRITGEDGSYIDRVDVKVGDQEAALFDTNGDGVADELRMDVNSDGQFAGNNEIVNLHEQGYEIPMREFAQEIGFDYDNITGAYADANGYHVVDEWNGMLNSDGGDVADNGGFDEGFPPDDGQIIDGEGEDMEGGDNDIFVDEEGGDDFAIVDDEDIIMDDDMTSDGTMYDDADGDVAELGVTDDEVELVGDQDTAMEDSDVMMVEMDEAPEEELMAMDDTQDFDDSGELELTDDAPADDMLADNGMTPEDTIDDTAFDSGMI